MKAWIDENGIINVSAQNAAENFAWENVIATDDMFTDSYIDLACGCYDG